MKKFLYVLIASTLLIACAPSKKNYLYSWGQYYDASYGYLKNKDDKSTQALVDNYKSIINKQTGIRGKVPPGIYADYGFLLMQLNQTDVGRAMLQKEIELYPESKVFIDRILNSVTK